MDRRSSILVVDDDLINIQAISAALKDGYDIYTVQNGNDAIDLLDVHKVDLILLDVMMPDISGFDVCKIIKADERYADIPVIFQTGLDSMEGELKGLELGGIDYITKPLNFALLKQRVRNHIALKEQRDLLICQKEELSELLADQELQNLQLRKTKSALRESEETYRTLFREMLDGFALHEIVCDDEGNPIDYRFLAVNPAFERLTGLQGDDLIGRTVLEVLPDTEKYWIESYGKVALTGEPAFFENYTATLNKYFEVSAFRPASGQFVCIFADITKHKQAEETIRRKQAMLTRTESITQVGSWEWDAATGLVTWSDELFLIVRLNPADGAPSFAEQSKIYHPEDMAELKRVVEIALRDGTPYELTLRAIRPDGDTRICLARGYAKRGANGEISHLFGSLQDVTEQKQVEQELKANASRMVSLYDINQYPYINEQDFLDHALNEIISFCSSKYGYIYFYNEASQQFTLNSWSRDVMSACSVMDQQSIYDLSKTGIWGEAVRQRKEILLNDFQAHHARKKGYPEGHVELTRFLTIPIIVDEIIVAVVGVANKECDYTDTDVMQLKLFMDSVWKITVSKKAEKALLQSEEQNRLLFDHMINGMMVIDVLFDDTGAPYDHQFVRANAAFEKMTGLSVKDEIGKTGKEMSIRWPPEVLQRFYNVAITGEPIQYERYNESLGRYYETRVFSPRRGQFAHIFSDISERKRAEEERAKLEAQLHQAQKMESVGRLAGGVAHDFNNKLSVILGHTYLASSEPNPDQTQDSLIQIRNAAEQSADLTQQLLAFARKQTIAPKVLDLNFTISGMLKMLQRLIGEDINLRWQPADALWQVKVDTSQIDQIMANLCVNARDSITNVGKITIETSNCAIDETYCSTHEGVVCGDFVRLSVSDNGCGMDKETTNQIFEPFFTTKEMGKGTGLGLSTVFGIVKQNNGFIYVYSEPGVGTTFTIYLPRYLGKSEQVSTAQLAKVVPKGKETILFVEDEKQILDVATIFLTKQGYRVLGANTLSDALRLAKDHVNEIRLLVTDVIMPEMNGKELSDKLKILSPQLECLFMSGYTADTIAHHGVLDEGVHFIQKPFALPDLAAKVREVLDVSHNPV